MVKIRLETDVQILEQQLQQMRATYQLNQEKLEYNFQVLKKRDEENAITKAQQKRKITRMQDVLNSLRIKLTKQEKQYRDENTQLTEDYKRIAEQFRDLQKKSKHFMATDAKKFADVWCMNEEECKEMLNSVLQCDEVIHQQQLGLNWETPDISFTENVGPLQLTEEHKSGVSATQVLHEIMSQTGSQAVEEAPDDENEEKPKANIFSKISAHTVKSVLELLCDESGFLVEKKLQKLLAPLEQDEQSLMKLDAIFTALGVESEEDIHKLTTYFMHLVERLEKDEENIKDEGTEKELEEGSTQGKEDVDAEIEHLTSQEEDKREQASKESIQLIHPNEVMKALRAFVDDHRKPTKEKGHKSQFRIAELEYRDPSEDSEYWAKYTGTLNGVKERVWDGLIEGLDKYNETLQSRSNLILETDALRQQNAELRMLLHQYVNSKVNTELEIPPTRVLQLEMNPQY
ncbi:hypothetical protein LOTGIDRAFT_225997 [Lottia gigantea]|uniref:Dynein regulatory complex protein 1 C-terminal domain-containing protein n=1 Tax=Lottia gigantea TaxID=225164 RepID=V4B1R1_LOTGI|nr:hypothetical protein LOTGIDRAFT_225997 [Lottia gigantea]ESP00267.1 hypothetical protein LOTGIDRAFT_225997 [Lottia gigantea]